MKHRRLAAFTLLEVLAAIVIFLLFIGSVFGVYTGAAAAIARGKDQQEVYQTARVLLAQMNTELTSAFQSSTATLSTLSGTVAADATTGLSQGTMTFITSAHSAPITSLPIGDLCQLTYEMYGDGSAASPIGLYVIEDYHPGLEMANVTLTPRLLSPRVIALNCLYLDSKGNWNNTWDNTTQTTLPVAVRIELTLQPRTPGANPVTFTSTANLLTATAPAATATTTRRTGGSNAATP